jgi:hypothetical protein
MSVKKFKFVSPGVFINEIDNSQLPAEPTSTGPALIGRFRRGPAMIPVQVDSFSDLVTVFGEPQAGGAGGDVWRDGNRLAPTYAAYAAQAWLRNSSPCTVVRLLGTQHRDATGAGEAGWKTAGTLGGTNGGAYGLFLFNSASAPTGVLAAVWYCDRNSVHISLTGSTRGAAAQGSATTDQGSAVLIANTGANQEFKAHISSSAVDKTLIFNLSENSDKYIRKVFNTNPTLCNEDITPAASREELWLGETFERAINDAGISDGAADSVHGMILGLGNGTQEWADLKGKVESNESLIDGQTGWFISQDLGIVSSGSSNNFTPDAANATYVSKLFKFHGLSHGEWIQNNLKVSIENIAASSNEFDLYGSFDVVLRRIEDSDNSVVIVESFGNCNLDPNSPNYLAKKIGDIDRTWDDGERRYRELGAYQNQSRFMRVEMNREVDEGSTDARLIPFGVYGPLSYKSFLVTSGTTNSRPAHAFAAKTGLITPQLYGQGLALTNIGDWLNTGGSGPAQAWAGTFTYPKLPLRGTASDGDLANPKEAYWGVDVGRSATSTRFEDSVKDIVRSKPDGISSFAAGTYTDVSWIFTLDDLKPLNARNAMYESGSRAGGHSYTAISGGYTKVLDNGFDRFTAPFFGGHDGVDIKEKDPFRNSAISGKTQFNHYAYNSIKRAMDSIADPEVVEMSVASMPGLTNEGLTAHLVNICEDRADALAVIDLKGGYLPPSENANDEASRHSSTAVSTTISNLRNRGLNSSYGCAYFPWVRIKDTISDATLWAPPSVAVVGTFSSVDRRSEPWFAPAGFTRGGLTEGAAGIPVIGVRQRLTSKDRDQLYAANINPIASFPAEGIVIFGQKTLQVTRSALDRVNVRRLMIFVKKRISFMASRLLFDQNVSTTWNRFHGQVQPFLRGVQARLGLTDFKVVLDETTTTPELIDRNIMYAKILLKPARAIEFIAIDFVITDSGASFED